MSIIYDLRLPLSTYEHCLKGKCGCADATACKFKRCDNCDNIIDNDGLAVDDGRHIPEHRHCPYCNGDTQ